MSSSQFLLENIRIDTYGRPYFINDTFTVPRHPLQDLHAREKENIAPAPIKRERPAPTRQSSASSVNTDVSFKSERGGASGRKERKGESDDDVRITVYKPKPLPPAIDIDPEEDDSGDNSDSGSSKSSSRSSRRDRKKKNTK